jgi:hypothetical protein
VFSGLILEIGTFVISVELWLSEEGPEAKYRAQYQPISAPVLSSMCLASVNKQANVTEFKSTFPAFDFLTKYSDL